MTVSGLIELTSKGLKAKLLSVNKKECIVELHRNG